MSVKWMAAFQWHAGNRHKHKTGLYPAGIVGYTRDRDSRCILTKEGEKLVQRSHQTPA